MNFFNNNFVNSTSPITSNPTDTQIKNYDPIKSSDSLKNGDTVVIIRKENSIYNYYKGYIGEIKKYNHLQDYINILLPDFTTITLPRDHFEKYN